MFDFTTMNKILLRLLLTFFLLQMLFVTENNVADTCQLADLTINTRFEPFFCEHTFLVTSPPVVHAVCIICLLAMFL